MSRTCLFVCSAIAFENPLTRGLRFIFTADPENIKAILATQFAVSAPVLKPLSNLWLM